jgi:WD40 repeat protein
MQVATKSLNLSSLFLVCLLFSPHSVFGQASPTPTPDDRGIGIQSNTSTSASSGSQQGREAKPELVLQTGYNNLFGATKMLFSPDGRLLATGTYRSSTIKLWETATGRKLRELSTGTQSTSSLAPSVAFSRDNRLIAVAAGDNVIKVWEVSSGRELQSLAGPQGSIMSAFGIYFLAFTPDNRIVSVSDAIRIWDATTGKEIRAIESGSDLSGLSVTGSGLALTPDGNQLALIDGGTESRVKLIDLNTGREAKEYKLPDKQIDALHVDFTPDGHTVAAGVDDKHLKFWDLSAKSDRDLGPVTKDFPQIEFSRDGKLLALSENYTVKIWDVSTQALISTIKVPNSGAFGAQGADSYVAFNDDGKNVVTGGFDTPTVIWETSSGKQLSKLSGRTNLAYEVAFSADGNQLSSGGKTRWDLRTGRGLKVGTTADNFWRSVQSPDGKLIAVTKGNSAEIEIFDAASGRKAQTLSPGGDPGMADHLHFSSDGASLITTYNPRPDQITAGRSVPTSTLKIWDVKSGREVRTINAGTSTIEARFSSDGRTIGTIEQMGQVSLWDVSSGSKIRDLTTSPMSRLTNMSNLPNLANMRNPKAIAAAMPNMNEISEMMTNTMGALSAGTVGRNVTSIAFSPDGRIIATGGVESKSNFDMAAMMSQAQKGSRKGQKQQDPNDMMKDFKVEAIGQVKLWDAATGSEIGALKGHGKGVTQVAFSRDSRLLASSSSDNTIKIWDVAARKELKTLRGHNSNVESIDFSPDARLIASASEDGSTFLWDAQTGEQLLTMISLDEGDEWMVVTPQGLFDGTPQSWNQILWRYNQETFNVAPIEWFFNEFYYPGLLSDIFYGKRPRVSQDVSKKDRRQPVVKLSLPGDIPASGITSRTVKVKIDVTDAPADKDNPKGSGAQDVRLFRNGSLVKVWRGDVLNGQNSETLEEEITVTAGPNRLVAYGFNKDNVKSKDSPLIFNGADSLKRKGTAYIIAVGLNDYANSQYNLKYAVADAQSFADEMRLKQSQVGDFERVEVVPLINENATKANILAAFRRLTGAADAPTLKATALDSLKRAQPEDTVIIYFAGHGTAQAQRFYLIPHDLGYEGDRTKLTEAGLKSILAHSISDIEIEQSVEGIDAAHMLLIIDACNSGQALEAEEKRRGPMNSKGLAQLAYEKGMYILTAAQSFQAALEAAQLGHGLLTYALVEEGLKTPVADNEPKDGVLQAREWLDFATDRVPQMQQEKMNDGRGVTLAFTEGEKDIPEPEKRSVQRPRVFYRRDMEQNPLVIAKP